MSSENTSDFAFQYEMALYEIYELQTEIDIPVKNAIPMIIQNIP